MFRAPHSSFRTSPPPPIPQCSPPFRPQEGLRSKVEKFSAFDYVSSSSNSPMNHSRLSREPVTDVQAAVVKLHDEAQLTFAQIGQQLDVTPVRVAQIYRKAHEHLRDFAAHGSKAICLLPPRARTIVKSCGYQSWANVRTAMETGELQTMQDGISVFWKKKMLSSVGPKTWSVLYEWAGQPIMPPCTWQSLYGESTPE